MGLNIKPKSVAKTADAIIQVTQKQGKEIVSDSTTVETVQLPAGMGHNGPPSQMCEVGMDVGYTHGLPNYSALRFGVSLKVPCAHDEIDAVYAYVEDWLNTKMGTLKQDLTGE